MASALTSPKVIKEILAALHIKPKKTMGQNFLTDQNILNKILVAANISPKDIILEIGPGIGTLTQELSKKALEVVAIEKDRNMVDILKETLKECNNVLVAQGDILKIPNFDIRHFIRNWKLEI